MTTYETAEAVLDLYQLREFPRRPFAERRLLEIGAAYETATVFKHRPPAPRAPPTTVEGV